jgi:hypothetical protein
VATIGAGLAGAALVAQMVRAVAARGTANIRRESLATFRMAANPSSNSASIAKATLEFNREVFEYSKAKDLATGGSKPKRPGSSEDPSSSSGRSLPLDSRIFPSLAGVSSTFSGASRIEDADADEVSRSLTRTPTPSTAEKEKQKGKGKRKLGVTSTLLIFSYQILNQRSVEDIR